MLHTQFCMLIFQLLANFCVYPLKRAFPGSWSLEGVHQNQDAVRDGGWSCAGSPHTVAPSPDGKK